MKEETEQLLREASEKLRQIAMIENTETFSSLVTLTISQEQPPNSEVESYNETWLITFKKPETPSYMNALAGILNDFKAATVFVDFALEALNANDPAGIQDNLIRLNRLLKRPFYMNMAREFAPIPADDEEDIILYTRFMADQLIGFLSVTTIQNKKLVAELKTQTRRFQDMIWESTYNSLPYNNGEISRLMNAFTDTLKVILDRVPQNFIDQLELEDEYIQYNQWMILTGITGHFLRIIKNCQNMDLD